MFHYVYRLTAKEPVNGKKYYVGKHSGLLDDLNECRYKTSSREVSSIFCKGAFNVKIVKIFESSKEAVKFESKYHKKLDVARHPLFFNNANQNYPLKNPFDRTGLVTVYDKKEDKNRTITIEEFKCSQERFVTLNKGIVTCKNKITGEIIRVTREEFDSNPDLVGLNYGVVHTKTKEGDRITVSKEFYRDNREVYSHYYRGLVSAFDKVNETFVKIPKEEFEGADRYIGANVKSGITKVKIPCEICGREIQKLNYTNHLLTHTGRPYEPVICPICKREFPNKVSYNSHKQSHNVEYTECDICGKRVQTTALAGHLTTHKERVKCEICGSLVNPYHLKRHIKKNH